MRRLLTDELAALHAWGVVLVLSFLALPASAQVAGVCGAGRTCVVRDVRTTTGTAGLCTPGSLLSTSGSTGYGGNGAYIYSDARCQTVTSQIYSIASGVIRLGPTGADYYATVGRGFDSQLAFASFPTCNAGAAGRLLYDSTNAVWRVCNGSNWLPQSRVTLSGMCRGPTTNECTDGQIFGTAYALTGRNYIGRITCGWRTAGDVGADGGAGRVVVRVVSMSDASDCRCDLGACGGSGDPVTCSCDKFFPTGAAVVLQNIQGTGGYSGDGGIAGDCVTHPEDIYCTAD